MHELSTPGGIAQGIVLFAHGSRDPLWRKPVEAVAARIRERAPDRPVACAYLELTEPDIHSCVARLVNEGADSITVLPLFLGVGKHAREDLPVLMAALKVRHPNLPLTLQPAVGEDARLLDLLATLALSSP